jgi:hypothetical protein
MARGGVRPGAGRPDGAKSKTTIEKELLAAKIMAEQAQKPGRKLAKEVLDDFMHLFMGLAAQYQPVPVGTMVPEGHKVDEAKFVQYAQMAGDFASKLVKFQSPTFGMMRVSVEPRFPTGADVVPALPVVPGQAQKLTPSQAYRLLRDADVIDMEEQPVTPANKRAAANGRA